MTLMLFLKALWCGEAILSVRGMDFVILMEINLNLMKLQAFRGKKKKKKSFNMHIRGFLDITNFHEELFCQSFFSSLG